MNLYLQPGINYLLNKLNGGACNCIIGGMALDDILEKKSKKSYSKNIVDVINTISYNDRDVEAVGSATYSIFKYPSDIDCFEIIYELSVTEQEAIKLFVEAIQSIIKKVNKKKDFMFADFKAGSDKRFEIDVGEFKSGKLVGYNQKKVKDKLIQLINAKLLKPDDYIKLIELSKKMQNLSNYEAFKDILKKGYVTIRWKPSDILKGVVTKHNKKFYLNSCIAEPGIIKIDAFTYLGGTRSAFIECSNFIVLKYSDKKGKDHLLNIPKNETMEDYLTQSIKNEMKILCNSKSKYYNAYKFCKRLFAICAFNKDEKLLKLLEPILTSSLAPINQIAADCETLISMCEKLSTVPYKKMLSVIDNFKPRISSIVDDNLDKEKIYEAIDILLQAGKYNTFEGFIEQLDIIYDYLKSIIKTESDKYVKKHKIIQLSKNYLK